MIIKLHVCFHISLWCIMDACVTIRGARVEWRGFLLRNLLNFAEEFAGGGLVESRGFDQTARLYGIQEAKCTHTVHISSVLGQVEGDLDEMDREEMMNT